MGRYLASLIALPALSGCSLIYNPNSLPTPAIPDAAEIDAYVADANPGLVELLDVGPAVLLEGQGVGGARPAVLALVGHQFVGPVTVELLPPANLPRTPAITVDNAAQQIAPGRDVVMVPVSIAIDTMIGDMRIPLTVKISQADGGGGTASATLEKKLQVQMLPELDAPQVDSAVVAGQLYARVRVTAGIAFSRGAGKSPAIVRAVSKIEVGPITADASGATPGPGGFAGGPAAGEGGGVGGGHAGTTLIGGSGAGFALPGKPGGGGTLGGSAIGDPLISAFTGSGLVPNYGSGGGGASGVGGGGGGTVELSAGGDLVFSGVSAAGGDGNGGVAGAGGGAGGAIVLRAGGTLSQSSGEIKATAGARGAGTGLTANGGAGSEGRIRIDAPAMTAAPTITAGVLHAGASFDLAVPLATMNVMPSLVIHGSAGDPFDARVFDASGAMTSVSTFNIGAGQTGKATPTLNAGYNRVCISPMNTGTNAESTTCIELAYLP